MEGVVERWQKAREERQAEKETGWEREREGAGRESCVHLLLNILIYIPGPPQDILSAFKSNLFSLSISLSSPLFMQLGAWGQAGELGNTHTHTHTHTHT